MANWGAKGGVKWRDVDEDGESNESKGAFGGDEPVASSSPQVSVFVEGPDKDGIKTVTEIRTENGVKTRVKRKIKVTRHKTKVNRHVLERAKWSTFGDVRQGEKNVTYKSSEVVRLNLKPKSRDEEKTDDPLDKLGKNDSIVVCRNCGETGHWTLKCPKRNKIQVAGGVTAPIQSALSKQAASKTGKYVPMHRRAGAQSSGVSMHRDDSSTIRVTNLSEETTEDDLRDLFFPYGKTTRIYLARDRQTQLSRGFAFISYTTRDSALKAIKALNGHGYANLILHVEMAKPREDKPAPTNGGAPGGGGWSMRGTR